MRSGTSVRWCPAPKDEKPVKSVAELKETVDKHGKGKPMLFRIQRQDASLFLTVTV
jgi:hypothetical protein